MKIVILAAGIGSRLNDSEDHLPKPLTILYNGRSILQYQLEMLKKCFSLHDIFIVVGYKKEVIMESFPNLTFIYNPNFPEENTSKSLLRALNKIDDDVLWLNGDVVCENAQVFEKIKELNQTCMVVNQTTSVGEEEVKYVCNEEGFISQVSKTVKKGQGEALGINFFKQRDLASLKSNLASCLPSDYFEKGIEESIIKGLKVLPLVIESSSCMEIDFPEDLTKVNSMMKIWSNHSSNNKN